MDSIDREFERYLKIGLCPYGEDERKMALAWFRLGYQCGKLSVVDKSTYHCGAFRYHKYKDFMTQTHSKTCLRCGHERKFKHSS